MIAKKSSVFAVHKWETDDDRYHEVTVWERGKSDKGITKRFNEWSAAERYAKREAFRLGLRTYMVDTPQRPHAIIKMD